MGAPTRLQFKAAAQDEVNGLLMRVPEAGRCIYIIPEGFEDRFCKEVDHQ